MSGFIDASSLGSLSIVDFLARLGHHPVYRSGKEHFYHSMIRETGKATPSLTVWDAGGKWRDWGGPGPNNISGGGIIQLGTALWPELPFVEVLAKICEVAGRDTELVPDYVPPKTDYKKKENEGPGYELVKTAPIGTSYVLDQYLRSRGIREVANGYLQEVYYRRRGQYENQREFYAVGWQNIRDGWEFANAKGFKSSIGPKDISIIPGRADKAVLFEGYMDFLSWLKMTRPDQLPTVIVLNSIAMLGHATIRIRGIPQVEVYFDNDGPGKKCTQQLMGMVPHAVDRSAEYQGFKDYNDKLKSEMARSCRGDPEPENTRTFNNGYGR